MKKGRKRKHGSLAPDGTIQIVKQPQRVGEMAKSKHRARLLAYLSNPDNEMPQSRNLYTKLLGLKADWTYIYRVFTADEMTLLENEALTYRRGGYAPMIAKVDEALLKNAAANGKAPEVALVYKRFEGWQEKSTTEVTHTLKLDKELQELLNPVYRRGAIDVTPKTGLLSEPV